MVSSLPCMVFMFCLFGWLTDLEAQLGDEVLSFRYFVQSPKELFCLPAPSEGR